MKKKINFILILLTAIALSACADTISVNFTSEPDGFWAGLWHGIISPFSFIGSLIWDDIAVYSINNTGGWYDFGFLLGVGAFTSGTCSRR